MTEDQDPAHEPETERTRAERLDEQPATIPDLGILSRVKVNLTVEVGQTHLTLRDLIRLGEGSVLELDRLARDTLHVLANGLCIAKGEVVMVGEKFGIRLGEVVEARKRLDNI